MKHPVNPGCDNTDNVSKVEEKETEKNQDENEDKQYDSEGEEVIDYELIGTDLDQIYQSYITPTEEKNDNYETNLPLINNEALSLVKITGINYEDPIFDINNDEVVILPTRRVVPAPNLQDDSAIDLNAIISDIL